MTRTVATALGALLILSLLVTAGCYTVLQHPTGRDIVAEDSYYRGCDDCHADASYYHPYYRYGSSHYRWSGYYGYPWWYDDYWWWGYDDYDDYDGESPDVERGTRHLWQNGGWAGGGWGFKSTDPPAQTIMPVTPATPATPEKPPKEYRTEEQPKQKDKKDEEQKEQEKKNDSEPRRLWRPKKKGS
jgi:hypothetical protein